MTSPCRGGTTRSTAVAIAPRLPRRTSWPDEASASPAARAPSHVSGASASSTTRGSSRSWPARCARSRTRPSAARCQPSSAHQVPGRGPAGPRGAHPASRPTPRSPRRSAPSSSSGSTASPRSSPRPPPATPRCSSLLAEDAVVSEAGPRAQARDARRRPGVEPAPEEEVAPRAGRRPPRRRAPGRPAVGASRASWPTRSSRPTSPRAPPARRPRRLADVGADRPAARVLRARRRRRRLLHGAARADSSLKAPAGRELMQHQAQVVAAAAAGHRTFLLADEPGLGKTAQALLAAQAADAYPLLVVVPERRQDQLGPRGRAVDPAPHRHRHPRRRPRRRRLRRHRDRQLRDPRPPRRLAGQPRLPRDGRRRGPLHQEQVLAALPARAAARRRRSARAPAGRC